MHPYWRDLGSTWLEVPWCLPPLRTPGTDTPLAARCSLGQATPPGHPRILRKPGSEFAQRCPKERRQGRSWWSRKIQGRQRKLSGEEILQHLWEFKERYEHSGNIKKVKVRSHLTRCRKPHSDWRQICRAWRPSPDPEDWFPAGIRLYLGHRWREAWRHWPSLRWE